MTASVSPNNDDVILRFCQHFSCWHRLLIAIAWRMGFKRSLKNKVTQTAEPQESGALTVTAMLRAETLVMRST